MTAIDILYCECEKVLEGKEPDFKISKPLANCVLHYGENVLHKREEVIGDVKSRENRIYKEWRKLCEECSETVAKIEERMWWVELPNRLGNYSNFYDYVRCGETSPRPKITREKAKELLESFGAPQLVEYLKEEGSKAEAEFNQLLESCDNTFKIIQDMNVEKAEVKSLIEELKGFDNLILEIEKAQPTYKVDGELLKRLAERMALTKVGVSLKVSD